MRYDVVLNMKRQKIVMLSAALTVLVGLSLWLINHGSNYVVIKGVPHDGCRLEIWDADTGDLAGKSFKIQDGMVDLGWGYKNKGSRLIFVIRDDEQSLYQGDVIVNPPGDTWLRMAYDSD